MIEVRIAKEMREAAAEVVLRFPNASAWEMSQRIRAIPIAKPPEDVVEAHPDIIEARRLLTLVTNDLQGRIDGGKLAALDRVLSLLPAAAQGVVQWQPIETAPEGQHILCTHAGKKWRRFGSYYSDIGRWYYSGTDERSQYTQVEGDAPTHWMPIPAAPAPGDEDE